MLVYVFFATKATNFLLDLQMSWHLYRATVLSCALVGEPTRARTQSSDNTERESLCRVKCCHNVKLKAVVRQTLDRNGCFRIDTDPQCAIDPPATMAEKHAFKNLVQGSTRRPNHPIDTFRHKALI